MTAGAGPSPCPLSLFSGLPRMSLFGSVGMEVGEVDQRVFVFLVVFISVDFLGDSGWWAGWK